MSDIKMESLPAEINDYHKLMTRYNDFVILTSYNLDLYKSYKLIYLKIIFCKFYGEIAKEVFVNIAYILIFQIKFFL